MVRGPSRTSAAAGAYLAALALLVVHVDGAALSGPLVLVVVGSAGLVVLLARLHPRPAVALADRRLHAVLGAVPAAIFCAVVYLPGVGPALPFEPPFGAGAGLVLCWVAAGAALYVSAGNAQARHYQERSERVVHLRVRPTDRTRRRRAAIAGILGVALVALGLGLVVRIPAPSSSLVMGLGFSALFSGVLGARRPRTYRLIDDGLIRQDSGAIVRTFVPRSQIAVAEREGDRLRLERRGPWYPALEFAIEDVGGDRTAAVRWFDGGASRRSPRVRDRLGMAD